MIAEEQAVIDLSLAVRHADVDYLKACDAEWECEHAWEKRRIAINQAFGVYQKAALAWYEAVKTLAALRES